MMAWTDNPAAQRNAERFAAGGVPVKPGLSRVLEEQREQLAEKIGKPYSTQYDEYVTCPECRQSWQLLDWGCAHHALYHAGHVPAVPQADQDRITANAAAHGVVLRWL